MEILLSMVLGITILLFVLISRKVSENFANIFLLLLLGTTILGSLYVIFAQIFSIQNCKFTALIDAMPSVLGSFIFLYVRYSTKLLRKFQRLDVLHFLPFIVSVPLFFFDTGIEKTPVITFILNIVLKILVSIIYLIFALNLLRKYKTFAINHFSNSEKIDLKWLRFLVIIGLISYSVYFSTMLLWFFDINIVSHIELYSNLIVILFILPISYYGLTATNVFVKLSKTETEISPQTVEVKINSEPKIKEPKALVSSEKADEIYENLQNLLQKSKLYRNEDLMLEDLATELKIHAKYLSNVINTKSGKSFFDFINSYRIAEFNQEVLNNSNMRLTFLAIAFNCGFGSKSAFNRAYKNEMGMSPSEFLKKYEKSEL